MKRIHILTITAMLVFGATVANAGTTRYVSGGASQATIQSTINASSSGDTVYLNDGTYYISSPLTFKSGVKVKGGTTLGALVTAYSAGSDVVFTLNGLNDVTISYLDLRGIAINIDGNSTHTTGLNNMIKGCNFKNSTEERFIICDNGKGTDILNNTFYRGSGYEGKIIKLLHSHNTVISGNTMSGYLETAINISGGLDWYSQALDDNNRTLNTDILDNTITREGGVADDHGIYAIGFKDCLIQGNTISGWSPTGSGGCVKARNGDNIQILSNTFNDSGVLLYVYKTAYPQWLKDVSIKYNTMNISGANSEDKARGVSYWSDFEALEDDFWIVDNDINNGCIDLDFDGIDVPSVNGSVKLNECPIIELKTGINAYSNVLK